MTKDETLLDQRVHDAYERIELSGEAQERMLAALRAAQEAGASESAAAPSGESAPVAQGEPRAHGWRLLRPHVLVPLAAVLLAAVVIVRVSGGAGGGSRMAASVTGCLSGSDSVKVFLKVCRVIDGDTFEGRMTVNTKEAYNPGVNPWAYELTKVTVRISGIDAPERGQFYGDVASLHLQWLISGKAVGLKLKQRDSYGRWIATAYLDGADIAEELLQRSKKVYRGEDKGYELVTDDEMMFPIACFDFEEGDVRPMPKRKPVKRLDEDGAAPAVQDAKDGAKAKRTAPKEPAKGEADGGEQ
jgi:endonuclease YncB( thermonuclease family)